MEITTNVKTPLSVLHPKHCHYNTYKLPYRSNFFNHKTKLHRVRKYTIVAEASAQGGLENVVQAQSKSTTLLNLTALVTVKFNQEFSLKRTMSRLVDVVTGGAEGGVMLQLLSLQVHPETMKPNVSKQVTLQWSNNRTASDSEADGHTYKVDFKIDPDFGTPGAISVSNQYQDEFFLTSISVQGNVHFASRSWIQPVKNNPDVRIFFTSQTYLPAMTPGGLIELRERELKNIQGDGKGLRLSSDRIYDYDVYNDIGAPDKGVDYARPTLGGELNPHPRRCRTGRPSTATDGRAEVPSNQAYVPRDEEYEKQKKDFMLGGSVKVILRYIIPLLIATIFGEKTLYVAVNNEDTKSKRNVRIVSLDEKLNRNLVLNVLNKVNGVIEGVFKLDPPKYISKDLVWGLSDEEFGRRVLAGTNPVSIEKLKSFPLVSKLDASIYGPQESALKEQHLIEHLEGMSIQQALDEDKLFVLDFHDMYLPFVDKINAIEGRKVYATRTIFFLTHLGTLKPIAIELSLPSAKKVVTPSTDGTASWLWQLAKEHVCANDTAIHTLVNHWLRIHACMEPFFISAHRNLSVMHPIFKLLEPHMRYLIKTNAYSRGILINAGAIIETFNAPEKYSMQLSCAAYRDWWRFDQEGLPTDLIRRGMAIPDASKPCGIRLTVEDYPYAQDGLLIWVATENLVKKYVKHYYPEAELVKNDTELQAWYAEAINVGHADVCNATWWPELSTPDDLINILTTIIWTVSGQHAVLNFGQYPYGAYVQTRPSFMRQLLPSEHDPDYKNFVENPKEYFLSSIPSLTQSAKYAGVLSAGSGRSPDEEYIGERKDLTSWCDDQEILEAFNRFTEDIKLIEKEIAKRNSDPRLRNRCGDKAFPFELLIPSSGSGTTGIPNSVTA